MNRPPSPVRERGTGGEASEGRAPRSTTTPASASESTIPLLRSSESAPTPPVYSQTPLPADAAWAVDPHDPGPDLPPAGRSLFDFLTVREEAGGRVQRVPFPFSALVAEIEERLGRRPGEPSPLKRVLIPLGRSLQRTAADPEFFRYPRAVVAVDTEAPPGSLHAGMLLKDRLYLGYHEKAEIIEVISYNETAGRFEFQLVRDYRPGGAAKVVYASRSVCTACHQGGGPLFARPLWQETNGNPEIARLLAAEGRDFYGLPVAQGVDIPLAIDSATDRANRIAVYQLLWREGCGSGESERAIRCRAAAFTAALQNRLSGGIFHDAASERFREEFLATARGAWARRWPQGLAIPDPDIPNRDPLAASQRAPVAAASLPAGLGAEEARRLSGLVMRSHVPAAFEPLNPRPPLEVWQGDDQGLDRMVAGLAAMLSAEDARRLDGALFAEGRRPEVPRERVRIPCDVSSQPWQETGERVKLQCGSLEGRVYLEGSRVTGGTISRLDIPGGTLTDLEVTGGTASTLAGASSLEISIAQKLLGLHVRRADGDAVELIRISWREGSAGEATVVFLDDFAAAEAAVRELAARTAKGESDAFSSRPFRRGAVMGALFAELGSPYAACCVDEAGMPPPQVEMMVTAGPADFPEPAVQALYKYCASCHATPEVSPPNFLYGETEKIRANLIRCSERIFYRLDVWRLSADKRPKTPMPPLHALRPDDPTLALLRRYASELLRAGTGTTPRLEDLEARGYESLRSCLPPQEAMR